MADVAFFFFFFNKISVFPPSTRKGTLSPLKDELQTLLELPSLWLWTTQCPGWWHHIPGEGCQDPGALHADTGAANTSLLPAAPVLEIKRMSTHGREKDFFLASVFRKSKRFPTPVQPESPFSYSQV